MVTTTFPPAGGCPAAANLAPARGRPGNRGKPSIRAGHLARAAGRIYGRRMMGFLVERYWPGVTAADIRAVDERLTRLGGVDATFVASTLIPADEIVFFEFQAIHRAAVLDLARRAGLRCDRLVSADRRTRADDDPAAGTNPAG
jgi:hypothetical protein